MNNENQKIENDYVTFWITGGILFCNYKSGTAIDIKAAEIIVRDRFAISSEMTYPCLADITGASSFSKDARDYMAKQGTKYLSANAVLISSPVYKVMANFYLKLSVPEVPTKLFTDKQDAINWLEQYKI